MFIFVNKHLVFYLLVETLKISEEVKDFALRSNLSLERANETNLFQEKEEDLIDTNQLKRLAGHLLQIQE
jgi:hypothetical protein